MKKTIVIAAMCVGLSNLTAVMASQGGTEGHGSAKPPASFGDENIGAILANPQVEALLGLSLEVTGVQRIAVKPPIRTYRVSAETIIGSDPCVFDVQVFSDDPTPVKKVHVTSVTVVSGCKQDAAPQALKTPSVFSTYADYFSQLDKIGLGKGRLYSDYIAAARAFSPAYRSQITQSLQADPAYRRFVGVYTANAQKMADFVQAHPGATVEEFYQFLGEEIMGLDLSQGGFVIPVVVGLDLAPLFFVDLLP